MPVMKPLESALNFTPNSSGVVWFTSTVPGVAVLGQIVQGHALAAAIVMLRDCVAVCWVVLESVTWTVKVLVPVLVGVPEITPPEDSVRDIVREPDVIVHVEGVVPPVALSA